MHIAATAPSSEQALALVQSTSLTRLVAESIEELMLTGSCRQATS